MVYLPLFTYIWLIFMVNVVKYTIHGCYGYGHLAIFWCYNPIKPWVVDPLRVIVTTRIIAGQVVNYETNLHLPQSFRLWLINQPPLTYPTQK